MLLLPEVAIFPADRYAIAQPRRSITGSVVVTLGRAMAFAPDWEPGFTEVWDTTFAGAVDLVPSDLPALNKLEDETNEQLAGSRTIIITQKAAILFSVKFYARLMKPRGREVIGLRTREEAARLLGIDHLPVLGE